MEQYQFKNIKTNKIVIIRAETLKKAITILTKKYPRQFFEFEATPEIENEIIYEANKK